MYTTLCRDPVTEMADIVSEIPVCQLTQFIFIYGMNLILLDCLDNTHIYGGRLIYILCYL